MHRLEMFPHGSDATTWLSDSVGKPVLLIQRHLWGLLEQTIALGFVICRAQPFLLFAGRNAGHAALLLYSGRTAETVVALCCDRRTQPFVIERGLGIIRNITLVLMLLGLVLVGTLFGALCVRNPFFDLVVGPALSVDETLPLFDF